ncbi:MAG: PhoH family protein [Phycisphaerae bacterium]|nr:PhoH family protein [Phycisphaerae bacterium]
MDLVITIEDPAKRVGLFGSTDRHLRLIREALGVRISARDASLKLSGQSQQVGKAAAVIDRLQQMLRDRDHLSEDLVADALVEVARSAADEQTSGIDVYGKTSVAPKTDGQRRYAEAIQGHDLVFCVGPAGTGKTYLAVAMAVALLKQQKIKRIVLVRPAVEAGEKLGYLPGDMQAKVNPYLRPLFDAMHDMMTFDQLKRFMMNDIIEVIPLAFMRGRTLNKAVVILDEAQNTTVSQMLMFLTRLGHDSKMIVTGDDSQVDLEDDQESGLIDAVRRLEGIEGIATIRLDERDIVRHRLVQDVVEAYAVDQADRRRRRNGPRQEDVR